MGCHVLAKKAPKPSYLNDFKNHYINTKIADCDYSRYPLQNNTKQAESILSFLKKEKADLFKDGLNVKLQYTKVSPYATHHTYQQYVNDVPVYSSQLKINVDASNAVYMAFYNAFSFTDKALPVSKRIAKPENVIERYYANSKDKITIDKAYTCIIFKDKLSKPVYATVANVTNKTQHWHHQVVIDGDLNMVYAKDLRTYFSNQDTVATAKIFNPDPLTTAMVSYGDPYIDYNDNNRAILNNETQEVMIPVCLENGLYTLKSTYVVIRELENPVTEIPVSSDGDFSFTRDEPGFEDVNALYHINVFKKYMDDIINSIIEVHGEGLEIDGKKIDKLVDYPIEVDAHAANGEDNSYFDPDLEVPGLLFGEGGVDDAEDADVIIHEYGHAISHSAAPFTNNGNERQSIDEGFGDYLAASYSRSISEFDWEKIFSWDGHNSFWNGRFANTSKNYLRDVGSSIHGNGEIWSSALMEIWPILGRKELDKIVLSSLYNYGSNTSMDAAAISLIKTDSLINDGANYFQIWNSLYNFGFVPFQAFAGSDTTICEGASLRLGGENIETNQNSVSWTPADNLTNAWIFNPTATPTESTWYYLNVTNENTQENFVDSIFVQVEKCGSEQIALLNSENYLIGENLFLVLPNEDEIDYKIDLFNMQGQKMGLFHEGFVGSTYQLGVNNIPSGVYFLRVFDKERNPHIFRFVRTR